MIITALADVNYDQLEAYAEPMHSEGHDSDGSWSWDAYVINGHVYVFTTSSTTDSGISATGELDPDGFSDLIDYY